MPTAIFSVFIIVESLGGKAGEGKKPYVRKLFSCFCASSGGWRAILLCFSPNIVWQFRRTPGALSGKRGKDARPPSQAVWEGHRLHLSILPAYEGATSSTALHWVRSGHAKGGSINAALSINISESAVLNAFALPAVAFGR